LNSYLENLKSQAWKSRRREKEGKKKRPWGPNQMFIRKKRKKERKGFQG